MAVFFKEMKHGLKGFCIWAGSIAFMLVICVLMFPEMKNEMNDVSEIFLIWAALHRRLGWIG